MPFQGLLGLSGGFWGLLGRSGAFSGLLGPPGALWDLLGLPGACWGLLGPSGLFFETHPLIFGVDAGIIEVIVNQWQMVMEVPGQIILDFFMKS